MSKSNDNSLFARVRATLNVFLQAQETSSYYSYLRVILSDYTFSKNQINELYLDFLNHSKTTTLAIIQLFDASGAALEQKNKNGLTMLSWLNHAPIPDNEFAHIIEICVTSHTFLQDDIAKTINNYRNNNLVTQQSIIKLNQLLKKNCEQCSDADIFLKLQRELIDEKTMRHLATRPKAKERILNLIQEKPSAEQKIHIQDALNGPNNLHSFFKTSRGYLKTSENRGSFKKLHQMLQKLDQHGSSSQNGISFC